MLKCLLIVVGCLCAAECLGQFAMERSAVKAFEKGKWQRGKQKLDKVFLKERYPVAAWYAMSTYYFSTAHDNDNLDSAHYYVAEAIRQFTHLPVEYRSPLVKFPIDSLILFDLSARIDSAAFRRATGVGTEESYNDFLRHFPSARQRSQAMALRDEVAFASAKAQNTHEAMAAYLDRYPSSQFRDEAQTLYDRLLFRASTGDQRLSSFVAYLETNPDSPFRMQVEEQIFEIVTASGSVAAFHAYSQDHPSGKWTVKAGNILYHLARELGYDDEAWRLSLADSLAFIDRLNQEYLVPVLRQGRFDFINQRGERILQTDDEELNDDYLCGNIQEDVLVLNDQLIARNGSVLFTGKVDAVDDLGFGFLLIESDDCLHIVHKSGFFVSNPCVDDAFVVNTNFIAARQHGKWFLYTLAGRRLFDQPWDAIRSFQGLVGMQRNNSWYLASADDLARVADQLPLYTTVTYDSAENWPGGLVWVKSGDMEGVIDNKMTARIPLANHQLQYAPFWIKAVAFDGVRLYDRSFSFSGTYHQVEINNHWAAVRGEADSPWMILPSATSSIETRSGYDTVWFEGVFAVGKQRDSVHVHYAPGRYLQFRNVTTSFIPSKDSTALLLVSKGNRKSVYNGHGKKLFEGVQDKVQYAGEGFFIVSKAELKGLTDDRGKILLPLRYHAIGEVSEGRVPLLRNMKFGMYDIVHRKELIPRYDKNLVRYNDELMIAFQNGKYGFVDPNNKTRGEFQYDEVRHWNDSVALVRENARWRLIGLKRPQVLYDDIRSFRWVSDTEKEKTIIFRTANGYGVMSNRRGMLIPAAFSDIVNVGSPAHPLYFTEKHVEEAFIFVVVYYDENGRALRRQVFNADEYDKIYCSEN